MDRSHVPCRTITFYSSFQCTFSRAAALYLALVSVLVMTPCRLLLCSVRKKILFAVAGHKSFLNQCFSVDGDEIQNLSTAPSSCTKYFMGLLESYHCIARMMIHWDPGAKGQNLTLHHLLKRGRVILKIWHQARESIQINRQVSNHQPAKHCGIAVGNMEKVVHSNCVHRKTNLIQI